ncbi:hypothetical protein [Tatumella sp. JGM118]|nr:hypothetical protein [Tatumella sp. JGM118]MBS0908253.1 hypothetical protein [Tatumella sp. JGM118]
MAASPASCRESSRQEYFPEVHRSDLPRRQRQNNKSIPALKATGNVSI